MILWVDVETTGLDEALDELLEVALVVSDDQLVPFDEGKTVVIGLEHALALRSMNASVRYMHERSGLLDEVCRSVHSVESAQTALLRYLGGFNVAELARAPLAGSNVKFDRKFLQRFMPRVLDEVHYRDICVSSMAETCRRFFPHVSASAPTKQKAHRAMADIGESIAEYRHYLTGFGAPALVGA